MCARYVIKDDYPEKVESLFKLLNGGLSEETAGMIDSFSRPGDVFPSEKALVMAGTNYETGVTGGIGEITGAFDKIIPMQMTWGLHGKNNGLMINARTETALQKPSFSDSLQQRRILIPASGFYEWDSQRTKHTFTLPDNDIILLAGFWRKEENGDHFIIMTREANGSMSPVHDRMPLIVAPEEVDDWFDPGGAYVSLMKKELPLLERVTSEGQMSLF